MRLRKFRRGKSAGPENKRVASFAEERIKKELSILPSYTQFKALSCELVQHVGGGYSRETLRVFDDVLEVQGNSFGSPVQNLSVSISLPGTESLKVSSCGAGFV
jgi:hypothetical protein